MKNKTVRGILALVVVTALSFGVILGSKALAKDTGAGAASQEAKVLEELDTKGAENIQKAVKTDKGYVVTVKKKGYASDIVMQVSFDEAGETVTAVEVTDQNETEGLGAKMPVIFSCFTVAAVSLTGIPPFGGFISKWNLGSAALLSKTPLGYAAMGVLLYSAFMTAIYMGTFALKAWFPRKEQVLNFAEYEKDPGWKMKLPIVIFACIIIAFGLFSKPLINLIVNTAYGKF